MYNPALPNHYRDVVFSTYVRRRQREEAEALEQQRRPNALASALSSLGSSAPAFLADAPSSLSLSAEELHQHRIKESAALGIQSAVDMEKEALEVEHKKKKLDGEDTRSRISSRLDKLKALAAKTKKATASPVASSGNGGDDSGTASDEANAEVTKNAPGVSSSPSLPTSSSVHSAEYASPALPAPSTAPLVFQRSSLAAGGYVMAPAPLPGSGGASSSSVKRPAVLGKPSSSLLLRYAHSSPLLGWSPEAVAQAATTATSSTSPSSTTTLCAPVLAHVQQLCRRFGFVRSMAARVYAADEVKAVLPSTADDAAAVQREQLRVWVRFDSVTEAFKAAETLAKESAGAGAAPLFVVSFYPTNLYDADTLQLRTEDEVPAS